MQNDSNFQPHSNKIIVQQSSFPNIRNFSEFDEHYYSADNIRRYFSGRLLLLQLIGIFLIIYLFTLPVFSVLSTWAAIFYFEGENIFGILAIITVSYSIYLIVTSFQNHLAINPIIGWIIIWSTMIIEPNQFLAIVNLLFALFLFELANIQKIYSSYLSNYSTYPNQQYQELFNLKIIFDQHLQFFLRLGTGIIAVSWLIIAFFDQVRLNLGGEGSIVIPILGISIIGIYFVFSPKFLRSLHI